MQYCKCFLLLLFIFSVSSLQAQRKFKQHFSYSLFFEQNRSFRILSSGNPHTKDWYEERQSTEKAISTANFGANILFHLNEKWAIKSGFAMAKYGRLTKPTDIIIGFEPDSTGMWFTAQLDRGKPIYAPNLEGVQYKTKFAYFEMPLSMRYNLETKHLSFFEFGLLLSQYRFEKIAQILNEEQTVSKYSSSNRKFNIGLEFLMAFHLLKTDFISIQLSPSFSIHLLKKDRFYGLDEQLYSYGLRCQMDFFSKR